MRGHRKQKLAKTVWLSAIVVAVCGIAPPPPPLPIGSTHFLPPAVFREWWSATEQCAGVSKNFAEISWYVVPGRQSIPTASGEKVGLWFGSASGSAIVLAGDWMHSELVVRHEILHHLLKDVEHPDTYFKDRCHLTWDTYWGVSSRDTG
jgi:hypothetical protein